jgi:hypothetical protein
MIRNVVLGRIRPQEKKLGQILTGTTRNPEPTETARLAGKAGRNRIPAA